MIQEIIVIRPTYFRNWFKNVSQYLIMVISVW